MSFCTNAHERLRKIANHFTCQRGYTDKVCTSMDSGVYSPLTTHVLDTTTGHPAAGLHVKLYRQDGNEWKMVAVGLTNSDGRCLNLITRSSFTPAVYKLHFETDAYFAAQAIQGFYPYVEIIFKVRNVQEHYHVPLILNPFSYSTYRGS